VEHGWISYELVASESEFVGHTTSFGVVVSSLGLSDGGGERTGAAQRFSRRKIAIEIESQW